MSDTGQGDRWQDSETSWHPPDSMRAGAARPVTPPRHSSGPSVEGEHDERSGSAARPSGHSKLWPPPDGASLLFPTRLSGPRRGANEGRIASGCSSGRSSSPWSSSWCRCTPYITDWSRGSLGSANCRRVWPTRTDRGPRHCGGGNLQLVVSGCGRWHPSGPDRGISPQRAT